MTSASLETEPAVRAAILRALRRADLTQALSDAEMHELCGRARLLRLARGESVWPTGEPSLEIAIVARGRVQCRLHGAGPRDWVSSVVRAQGACGLPEVVAPCVRRWSVEALEPSLVVTIEAQAVAALLEGNHAFALHFARLIARELRATFDAAEGVALHSPLERVASYLLDVTEGGTSGELDATQGRVAARLGTVREVVGRSLRRLERAGLIERHGRAFRVLRAEELRRIASGDVTAVTSPEGPAA